jgi:AcrR family transcriptional regulator
VTAIHSEDRRKSRKKQRRDEMLRHAQALIADEGIDALTLGRLARDFDLVPAALYRYFASKDALIAELQRRTIEALHPRFAAAVAPAGADDSALGPLLRAGRFYLALPAQEPEAYAFITQLLGDPRPLVPDDEALRTAPALLAFLADVAALIRSAQTQGALAPGSASQRALMLWAALQGVCQLGKLGRFDSTRFDVPALGDATLTTLLLGWGAAPDALKCAFGASSQSAQTNTREPS